jgi:hypothetical protein
MILVVAKYFNIFYEEAENIRFFFILTRQVVFSLISNFKKPKKEPSFLNIISNI